MNKTTGVSLFIYRLDDKSFTYIYRNLQHVKYYVDNSATMVKAKNNFKLVIFVVCVVFSVFFYTIYSNQFQDQCHNFVNQASTSNTEAEARSYNASSPLIFIGGMPRSGTTLMRALLDAHPYIRCGEETRLVPNLLFMRNNLESSKAEKRRLFEAGINTTLLDNLFKQMILEIIVKHGSYAPYFCNKDPFALKFTIFLSYIYPNSKFILMIRDGRAVIHSVITRKVPITGFNRKNKSQCLKSWNQGIGSMYAQCVRVGPKRCLPVYYEQLVLHKEDWLHRIFDFLDIPWSDDVLHHEDFIDKPGGISISKSEFSTNQIVKPVNTEALTSWLGFYDDEILDDMDHIAPMLRRLGYDPDEIQPNYEDPPEGVFTNTLHLTENKYFWKSNRPSIFDKRPYNSHLSNN